MRSLILIAACVLGATCVPQTFHDYQVWRVKPQYQPQLEVLHKLSENTDGYLFWSDVSTVGRAVDIMVSPEKRSEFFELMNRTLLDHQLFMDDVERYVQRSNPAARIARKFDWTTYGTLDEIHDWLRTLPGKYPGIVELVEGGSSYEGRKILGVKVSYSSANAKRGVFLEGSIHAREWISSAVVTYTLNELLSSKDPEVRAIAEHYDWYVFPNTNPDGYVYTFEHNRMWRKTRTPYGICFGADPNRNWDYQWNVAGASNNPCTETYAGKAAFSEVETRTLSQYISTIADNLVAYIAHHSYSQLLLLPYGSGEYPKNYDELYEVGQIAAKKLREVHGTRFQVGNIVDILYPATGGSMDWVKGKYNTRFAFTYELRDTGAYGFLLPEKYIKPSGEEMMAALKAMIGELTKRS